MSPLPVALLFSALLADPLGPGDHVRKLSVDGRERTYQVHVPESAPRDRPCPVVLILHGARTNAAITVVLTGMNQKSDQAGFIAVYPNGTGSDPFLYWNAGQKTARIVQENPDDVKYIRLLLDDLATATSVDPGRIYATGLSNGGMMCYRLASELSDRIAAIAPVAGTMALAEAHPKRRVPVMHFHGTADSTVKYLGKNDDKALAPLKSVDETIEVWRKIDDCQLTPTITDLPDLSPNDGCTVRRTEYRGSKQDSEVVLYTIVNGGHTWPGQKALLPSLGNSTLDISANDLMWEFFQKHPMRAGDP